jgi:hypothetical protein
MKEKGNEERVQVGKPEGKITITRHEYGHITSAVTRLNGFNTIDVWSLDVKKISIFPGM